LLDILDDEPEAARLPAHGALDRATGRTTGEVMRQWFKDLYQGNKLVRSELVLGGRAST
jgi:hypothetical protein